MFGFNRLWHRPDPVFLEQQAAKALTNIQKLDPRGLGSDQSSLRQRGKVLFKRQSLTECIKVATDKGHPEGKKATEGIVAVKEYVKGGGDLKTLIHKNASQLRAVMSNITKSVRSAQAKEKPIAHTNLFEALCGQVVFTADASPEFISQQIETDRELILRKWEPKLSNVSIGSSRLTTAFTWYRALDSYDTTEAKSLLTLSFLCLKSEISLEDQRKLFEPQADYPSLVPTQDAFQIIKFMQDIDLKASIHLLWNNKTNKPGREIHNFYFDFNRTAKDVYREIS